jgi:hypothetical protein
MHTGIRISEIAEVVVPSEANLFLLAQTFYFTLYADE